MRVKSSWMHWANVRDVDQTRWNISKIIQFEQGQIEQWAHVILKEIREERKNMAEGGKGGAHIIDMRLDYIDDFSLFLNIRIWLQLYANYT